MSVQPNSRTPLLPLYSRLPEQRPCQGRVSLCGKVVTGLLAAITVAYAATTAYKSTVCFTDHTRDDCVNTLLEGIGITATSCLFGLLSYGGLRACKKIEKICNAADAVIKGQPNSEAAKLSASFDRAYVEIKGQYDLDEKDGV